MDNASRDQNYVTTLLAVSSVDGVTPVTLYANPTTHRLLVDLAGGGSGTVQTISIATANGFAGTSNGNASAPALTITTSVTGVLYGNGTAMSALTIGSGLNLTGSTLSTTGGGTGTVTDVSVVTANGVSGSVATSTTTPAITLTLGAITPTSVSATSFVAATPATDTIAGVFRRNNSGQAANIVEIQTEANAFLAGFDKVGKITVPSANVSGLTASEIVITDASKNLTSAAVATYPSLTELTYLKGVSSAIQTQLGGKQSTITFGTGVQTALGVNIGAAGAPVLFNGALGTPTSGTVTNLTGTASININGTVGATTPTTGSFTSVTTSGAIELGNASDTTVSRSAAGVMAVEGVVIPSISSTNTLTNKRITPRVGSTTSSATPTINTDNVDAYHLTAQAADITSFTTNLTGTPTDFQQLRISVTGTAARAITWGSSFANGPVALPTTTVTTTRLDVLFQYDTVTSKWRCMASGSTV